MFKNMSLEKVPVNCRICKFLLNDSDFIEKYKTQYVCSSNDGIDPKLLGIECEAFKLGKWSLVEFLEALIKK